MQKAKRGGDDLTRRFRKNRRACKNESSVSGRLVVDSNRDFWSGLSDGLKSYLSKSVVSITLCDGDAILFSCSGIAIERRGCHLSRFLTSASLVRALNATNKDHDDLKIEVRHEGSEVHIGVMGEFDLGHNFSVVNVHALLDVQVGPFQSALEILPHGETLVAVGRGVSGEIVAKSVELDDSRLSEDDGDLDCNISEAWEGGHVLSMDGKVGGMYRFLTRRRAVFLPWGTILKHLEQKKTGLAQSRTLKVNRFGPIVEKSNSHPEDGDFLNQEQLDLDFRGYPKLPPSMLEAGMILLDTFEDTFGDIRGDTSGEIHGEGVWKKFGTRASNINSNVVALASFNGERRFFACTGFIIEWNGSKIILTSASLVRNSGDEHKIVENLTIDVLLHNQCTEGTLQHYNLHYNVALVSVKEVPDLRPSNTLLRWKRPFKVAAVGRCFLTGALMATSGDLVPWTGTLDCHFLARSTCKISKAGIGGPLVTLDGDVIGMNFYDKRIGTPFLFWVDICKILASFETKSKSGEVGNDSDPCGAPFWKMNKDRNTKLNSWPVPMPRWCHRGTVDEDKSDDDNELGFEPKSGRQRRYSYFKGKKIELF
ncbi:unnamed protein product [Urochloa decumbens]|uniref:Uncharacterized protein n=1 Tax=Urochloa decumbens TaxID=240449 RepID=A0ABC9EW24_9POAL